ncbi:upstream stimulatory factor 2-like isoform X1 [Limulus polyphemus]|uniref:Upstream stimulatory factor 2-like isoform X1 n=2 Tax=Limulus polyphemus TaxID=6850 RepID=A0ABM1T3V2_LIMPO|nr:upstream stimulatory factor 2-like isoform X1 [Limulus polyphemus]XP_022250293.1 upstream stimulatory factor 2-like isoform X1 [Limulus polyphemus]XP_022250337.1 upstream stimulatory factor 2-like isoform X1 [Limulus polyphemus]XP_022250398.1 upstream stimulatory factor 2-like isoform X1 [Limulus polyphemus]XP_022250445.1 upstream stimulatory factor 2-like isoform X1 [Limulus polyphemus]XP_022250507.1 upstream stimulatory factor 2-like isoform X1 [Limulus polyphemus]XP_022250558.1 upstream
MDMLDQSLDTSGAEKAESGRADEIHHIQEEGTVGVMEGVEHGTGLNLSPQGSSLMDPNVQYQLHAENGHVTYRVVRVAPSSDIKPEVPQVVTTATAALVGQQVAQAIITNPYATANGASNPEEGQFYVMMSPQEVYQPGQRSLAPRTEQFTAKVEKPRAGRDEKRRSTHNEVERRRRDKINNWIAKLSTIVPDCTSDHAKQSQHSKGGILAKACDYIQELRNANAKLPNILKENERLTMDVELLQQQYEELKNENRMLRAHLQQHGINLADRIRTHSS